MGKNSLETRLFKAIRDLRIDVPIQHYDELEGGGLRLYLYGGGIVEWKPDNGKERRCLTFPSGAGEGVKPRRKRSATPPRLSPAKPEREEGRGRK